jgi:small subunit ribosomal protein S4
MGKPKFSRKKYVTPSHPWQEERIKEENELIKKYGLKNKREVWRAETRLRKYRGQARELLAKVGTGEAQIKKESDQLLMHLSRMNILPTKSTLDDVLALETESILSRRLQTLAYLKGLANTPTQARQLISHGHIAIGDRRVTVPGYIVTKDEEGEIGYTSDSPLNDMMHPARPRADFKSAPIKKEEKPVEEPPKEEKPSEEPPKEEEKPTEEPPKEETPEPEKPEKPPTEEKAEEPPKETPPEPESPKEEEKPAEEPATEPSKEEPDSKKDKEAKKSDENKEGEN